MIATSVLLQILAIGLGAPLLSGVMGQVRARLEGRIGPGALQPFRDIRKLLLKQNLRPEGTSIVFIFAPYLYSGSSLALASMIPIVAVNSSIRHISDLFMVVGVLLIGTVAQSLGGLDTGTAFGGMGASRTSMILSLIEPTILMAIYALSIPAHSSDLTSIITAMNSHPSRITSPATLLSLAGLLIVVLSEAGRLPIDNPSTHLELTMIHEATTLEYSGPRLAVLQWGASVRLALLLALIVNLFFPIGLGRVGAGVGVVVFGLLITIAKITTVAIVIAGAEVSLAKLALFRIPELLAGSFLFAFLAVTASYYLAAS